VAEGEIKVAIKNGQKKNNGMRWKIEGLYSRVKRIFGETVWATYKKHG